MCLLEVCCWPCLLGASWVAGWMERCFPPDQLRLTGSPLETALYTLLFPPLCLAGLAGNALNFAVLLHHDSMSRANMLLSCLAVTDICFLLLMIPHSLANFDTFALSHSFRSLYLPSKMHLIALANWTSAVAIWLVVLLCGERVLGVRSPLHRLGEQSKGKLTVALAVVVALAGALTCYNHVSHHCVIKSFCHDTQLIAVCLDVNQAVWPGNRTNLSPPSLRRFVQYTRAANAVFVVAVPLVMLVSLNAMLMYYVKKRSFFVYESLGRVSSRMTRSGEPALPCVKTLFRRHSDQILQQKTEHRVAVTVCAIVTSFTITQAPSAVVLCVNSLWPSMPLRASVSWYHLTTVTSFLVVVGKTLNLVVFCLSSKNFRRRVMTVLRTKFKIRDQQSWHKSHMQSASLQSQYTRVSLSRKLSAKKSFQSI